MMNISALLENMKAGGGWYGAFLELLDKYADLRADLDFSFIQRYGQASQLLPGIATSSRRCTSAARGRRRRCTARG